MKCYERRTNAVLWKKTGDFYNQCRNALSCDILCFQTCTGRAEEKFGLNDKISVQYSRWIHQVFHGNFGRSYKYKMDVLDVLKSRLGNTLLLGGTGFLIIFAGALLLGVICAWKEGGWLDKIICKAGTIISCVPEFWLALVLILVFSVSLRWLPSSGAYAVGQEKNISDRILHMILPLTVIVTEHLWYYGYMVRNKCWMKSVQIMC